MEIELLLPLINEWWRTNNVDEAKLKKYYRDSFSEIKKLVLEYRPITMITGLRRVGKTIIIFQLIDHLLKTGTSPKKIVYFSFDEQQDDIFAVLDSFQKVTGTAWTKEKVFVFFDEIQKLRGWASKIKMLYDQFPRLKIILSGSASLQLEKEAIDNLAGRYFIEELKPLSLKEYYELSTEKRISPEDYKLHKRELSLEFYQYIKKPFPELVEYNDDARIFEYIRESVVTKIVKVDLPDTYNKVNTQLLGKLIDIFYSEPGMILNLDSMSRDLGIWKKTLEEHIFYMEFSKLIKVIRNFRPSSLSASRKLKKVYPYHISLAIASNPDLDKGKVAEALVASEIDAKYYWRENGMEVDFIERNGKKVSGIEVKAKLQLKDDDLRNVVYFGRKFGADCTLVYLGEPRTVEKGITAINLIDFVFSRRKPGQKGPVKNLDSDQQHKQKSE